MAQAAFSEDGKYFSIISNDGRLKIWDAETNVLKQEYTPDLHLSSPPTCLQWIVINTSESPGRKKRNSQSSGTQSDCILLGTTNGKVLVYSVANGKLETVLEDKKNGQIVNNSITSLDWSNKYGLFSCNKDYVVHEWDISSGQVRFKYNVGDKNNKQKKCFTAVKCIPHNLQTPSKFLAVASWQVKIFRLLDGDSNVVLNLGHIESLRPLLNVASSRGKSFLVVGSQNERLLSFWDANIEKDMVHQLNGDGATPNKKQRTNSFTAVTLNKPAHNFVLEDAPKMISVDMDEGLKLAAVTRSGVLHYYCKDSDSPSTKPTKPTVTIQISTPDAKPVILNSCKLVNGQIVFGYDGAATKILFERCTPDLTTKTQVLIRGETKTATSNEVNKVRSDAGTNNVTYIEPMGGVVRKRGPDGGKTEIPMEARLENLALDPKDRSSTAVNQNLTKLLVQGLHSSDKNLILTVLQNNDEAVASKTVASLPADYVPLLVEQLAEMASRKTSQCASVCIWLSALLRSHCALLLASINSQAMSEHLQMLLATFTQRRSHLCQLLNLKGRLDLTVSQKTSHDMPDVDTEAVLNYNDSTSDEEELENNLSENDDSWDDDIDDDE